MSRRRAAWLRVPVIAPMHGQQIQGGRDVTLYACDCIAAVENEQTGLKMNMRIVSCEYTSERSTGEHTRMELIPEDQELFL
jgi:prophage tail gpP-like protein